MNSDDNDNDLSDQTPTKARSHAARRAFSLLALLGGGALPNGLLGPPPPPPPPQDPEEKAAKLAAAEAKRARKNRGRVGRGT